MISRVLCIRELREEPAIAMPVTDGGERDCGERSGRP